MNKEEKQLLLKDLCARLPYGVKITFDGINAVKCIPSIYNAIYLEVEKDTDFKPYLRPMSSMTEDERKELRGMTIMRPDYIFGMALFRECYYKDGKYVDDWTCCSFKIIDWLNAHHFDYRGLINNGLALEAPEGLYK